MAQPSLTPRLVSLVGLVVASWLTVGTAWAQATVAGDWVIEVDSPQGVMKVALKLSVEGEALNGSIASEMGETPLKGTAKDGAIKFSFDFVGPQGPVSITTTGTVTGNDIKGEMDYGMGIAPFTGKRAEK